MASLATGLADAPPLTERRKVSGGLILVLTVLALALAGATMFVMNRTDVTPEDVRYVLMADLAFLAILVALIARRVWKLISARRHHEAGAALHLRLTGIFTIVALAPTVLIAAFATFSVNQGLESYFSAQVGSVVRNSLITAQSYAEEHRRSIEGEVLNMANDMNRAGALGIADPALAELLRRQQRLRRFPEAYLIDGARDILHRGDFSYRFTYDAPSESQIAQARLGNVVVLEDKANNELRALVYLNNYIDTFLYVTRQIDGEVLLLLDETEATVSLYNRLQAERGRLLSTFALVYLGFALLVVASAAWFGLWMAERLSRPIGRLAAAAERVGQGDLDHRVPELKTGDEIALLSRMFNRMTAQVKGQRDELVDAHEESEQRRNFIETVLSGVSAGVVGLGPDGQVEMMNDAAHRMLGADAELPPELIRVFETAAASLTGAAQGQVSLMIDDAQRELLVRVAARSSDDFAQGYVMTLDDLTALVSAQREAAWGDVARRIAHEIKNPLTPIQLSAERLRRKIGPIAGDQKDNLEQYADVIIRQAGDIRRMVDEFSKFARMPAPEAKPVDLAAALRDAVLLQNSANGDIEYVIEGADAPVESHVDAGMINQALTNLLKNAAEAIEGRLEAAPDGPKGRIVAALSVTDRMATLSVEDNGVGLPTGRREELTEPYVTTRDKGTGLGLAIVKKIAEQHGGALTLGLAETAEADGPRGARVAISLPRRGGTPSDEESG